VPTRLRTMPLKKPLPVMVKMSQPPGWVRQRAAAIRRTGFSDPLPLALKAEKSCSPGSSAAAAAMASRSSFPEIHQPKW